MAPSAKTLRVCSKGHQYYKSSNCPVCPVCAQESRPDEGFMSLLAAPARRALMQAGITSLTELAGFSATDLLQLHGIGQASIPKLQSALEAKGLSFKK